MAEQTTSSIRIAASPADIMAVIADFGSYPEWVIGMQEATVMKSGFDGRAEQVRFVLDAQPIKDTYTLAYIWDADRSVTWTLVDGGVLRGMDGAYQLAEDGTGTEVTYRLGVEVAFPMIGMLKRKAEKVIIDTALKGLRERVESLG